MSPPIARPRGLARWLLLLALLLCPPLSSAAGSGEQQSRAILNALFRLHYDEAEQGIRQLQQQQPEHHLLGFLHASVLWLKAEAQQGGSNIDRKPAWVEASKAYEQVIKEAEQRLQQQPADSQWRLTLGLSQFFAARSYIEQGKITRVYHYARASRDTLRELIEQHPDAYDAYLGLGVYEYVAGSIPRGVRWLAALFDISGDQQKGLEYLRLGVQHAPLMAPEAARMLLAAAALQPEYVDQPCQYLALSRQTLALYPENAHFSGAYQMLHANCGYAELALKENQHARQVYLQDFPDMEKILDIVELSCQRSLGNLPRLQAMKPLFKTKNTAYWHLAMGQVYDLLGRRTQALEHYHTILNSELDHGIDTPDVLSNSDNRDWLLDQVEIHLRIPFTRPRPYPVDAATALTLKP